MSAKEQRLKKIKRRGGWGGFISLIFITGLLNLVLLAFVHVFVYYILKTALTSEVQKINSIALLYEDGISDEQMQDFFGGDSRIYVVRDKEGKILHQTGEDTMNADSSQTITLFTDVYTDPAKVPDVSDDPEMVLDVVPIGDQEEAGEDADEEAVVEADGVYYSEMTMISHTITVYTDREKPIIVPKRGILLLDIRAARDYMRAHPEDFEEGFINQHRDFELPFWIAKPLSENRTLFGKAVYRMSYDDLTILLALITIGAALMFVTGVVLIFSLIHGFRRQRKLTAVFFMDEVTGGHNWMWFLMRGGHFIRKRRNDRYNYAVADLVFVNYRNYCMCHSIAKGEQMLARVDRLVDSHLDSRKEYHAHYASANFAMMLRYGSREQLEERLKEIIASLERIDTAHNFNFHIGVALLPSKTDKNGKVMHRKNIDLDEEYNNACTARATLSDRDNSDIAFFDEKLVEEQRWLDIVQEEQKKALDQEEFLVYYQPKYNPVTNELSGAEALVRWNSPKYGFQGPGKFIPIFEKNGFITEIDHYMIRHVARDQKRWLDEGKKCVPVSVNVSRAHFVENDLAEQIRDMIDAEGTPHELIELELTESAFFDDKKAIISTIKKLKEYGFTVSMDDFGSGYSSLNSLKDMPLDVLKLDAEFFRGEDAGERGEIVVTEALRLAKALHMKTVAEGVEIKEQVDFLANQGCDMIQGYYFAKPMPSDQYEQKMSMA